MSIDGLSGLHSVELVRMFINPKLCYIGNETVTEAYWQVNNQLLSIRLIIFD